MIYSKLTATQVAEMFRAQDMGRMLEGKEEPRQEAFVMRNGEVDWDRYDQARNRYNSRRAA